MKRIFSVILAALLIFSVVGCNKSANNGVVTVIDENYPWLNHDELDSSDLPDWEGNEMTITYWQAHGTSAETHKNSESDVVIPELERITGVKTNEDEVIDNAGKTFEVKLGSLIATKDYPSIVLNPVNLKQLVEADIVYDLTELGPKYAPTIFKNYPEEIFSYPKINGGEEGKIYALPFALGNGGIARFDPNIDKERYSSMWTPRAKSGYVWVRDDILKMLYPEAKTQDEIEALYMANGKFTEEELYDVPINTYDDFMKMLYDIKGLGIVEDGKPVNATFGFSGGDNWPLMSVLWNLLDGCYVDSNNMFTYWDRKSGRVELALKQDFFKESLQRWNKLVQEDVVPKTSLLDLKDMFEQKLNNGQYAVAYAWLKPDEDVLKAANKPYRYRKVYLNIPANEERFLPLQAATYSFSNMAIFKNAVKEEELPQLLMWMDFQQSAVGSKLLSWGPKTAGLWEEKDGKRVFKDNELANDMIDAKETALTIKYNLVNGGNSNTLTPSRKLVLPYTHSNFGMYHPKYTYDRPRVVTMTNDYFNSSMVDSIEPFSVIMPDIWAFGETVPEAKKAYSARSAIEIQLTKVLAAENDADFEKVYNELITVLDRNGWNDEMLEAVNKEYQVLNANYMDNLR